jgi:uncharacterized membrane protein YfcA
MLQIPGGVAIFFLLPVGIAIALAAIMAPAGVSGAFLLLPLQFSVLAFTSPAVTPTNHLYNVVAIPSGVYRYIREGRMLWPLAIIIAVGTVPGAILGSILRVHLLSGKRGFTFLIAFVLLLIGLSLVRKILRKRPAGGAKETGDFRVEVTRFDVHRFEYRFRDRTYGVSSVGLSLLTLVIGVIGGAYGVGGGAIISPILVALYGLPVHTIAGATLFGTCLTSFVAVGWFTITGPSPFWELGLLFGVGGLIGMYCGARVQRYIPARAIEIVLACAVNFLAITYLIGAIRG